MLRVMVRPQRGHWLQLPAQAVPQLEQVLVVQPQPEDAQLEQL